MNMERTINAKRAPRKVSDFMKTLANKKYLNRSQDRVLDKYLFTEQELRQKEQI